MPPTPPISCSYRHALSIKSYSILTISSFYIQSYQSLLQIYLLFKSHILLPIIILLYCTIAIRLPLIRCANSLIVPASLVCVHILLFAFKVALDYCYLSSFIIPRILLIHHIKWQHKSSPSKKKTKNFYKE